jgi:hypothetical protein
MPVFHNGVSFIFTTNEAHIMSNAICCVPVSAMRAEPAHRSEMVSQQLFGESCTVTERAKDNWIKIRCSYDDYEGWCQESHVMETAPGNDLPQSYTGGWLNDISYNGQLMRIPFGSSLHGIREGQLAWKEASLRYEGGLIDPFTTAPEEKTIRQFAFMFLNTAYLWGGKSVFGVDCSGFCQTVFKLLNIRLHRDAYQQATQGEAIGFLQEVKCGDLAFFDNEEGRITHVGILLNEAEIIHASVKVRVDKIDNMGIINTDTNLRTHKLRVIKRIF